MNDHATLHEVPGRYSRSIRNNAVITMAKTNEWAGKVVALIKGGNSSAAIAQIKVAPSVKDLKALHATMHTSQLSGRWRDVDAAIDDSLALLSAPRLHRSP
ncbi:hypothetical protein ABIE13_000547 [Ottowia thiooxydans]|uniref:Uncharacterized protein n=2 Tax=Ottowia thiooxydans TaxID=219182 RepID=A0ABV2Q357_9BURK